MKRLVVIAFVLAFSMNRIFAGEALNIQVIDNRISVQAEAVPLSRLFHVLDKATGMTSQIPPQLNNRTITVHFTNLNLGDAIHKIFEGQSLDYVFVEGRGVIVTGIPKSLNLKSTPAPSTPVEPQEAERQKPSIPAEGQQPQTPTATSQQPSGSVHPPVSTIPNPAANPPMPELGPPSTVINGQGNLQDPFHTPLPGFIAPNPSVRSNSTQPQGNTPYGATPAAPR